MNVYPQKEILPLIEHHKKLPLGANVIAEIQDENNYGYNYMFLLFKNELIVLIHREVIYSGQSYYSITQVEFPLEVLPWFVDKLEFFMLPSSQGGLRSGKIETDADNVGGEYLTIMRLMRAGCEYPGYKIVNKSRTEHDMDKVDPNDEIPKNSYFYQGLIIPDNFLFEGGLLELWKDLAKRYQEGTL
ncbi:hypothetical protein [Photobacterium galatheae]|uniref:Uncharacterized protein n=1 Tax=Photobacterium galatheae TaxID=1654360 RepID=A0A066RQA2_9GAMM|nr:hypothetical protein [Photobacterium galatheae]KDM91271.1 hypothetical protein EA58_11900 [Photobacterium galatheae]MCM0150330.1 hypothetical protein [Photobacterium galatheae]